MFSEEGWWIADEWNVVGEAGETRHVELSEDQYPEEGGALGPGDFGGG